MRAREFCFVIAMKFSIDEDDAAAHSPTEPLQSHNRLEAHMTALANHFYLAGGERYKFDLFVVFFVVVLLLAHTTMCRHENRKKMPKKWKQTEFDMICIGVLSISSFSHRSMIKFFGFCAKCAKNANKSNQLIEFLVSQHHRIRIELTQSNATKSQQ